MIKENAIRHKHVVGLAIVRSIPVTRHFADSVGTPRLKRRFITLRCRCRTKHFRRSSLIKAHWVIGHGYILAGCFQKPQRSRRYNVGGILGLVE